MKLPFHTAAHVVSLAPCLLRFRLGLLLVLREVIPKGEPVKGPVSEIGKQRFGSDPVGRCGKSSKGPNAVCLDFRDIEIIQIV